MSTTFASALVDLGQGFKTASKLDFIQLRGIAYRVNEAFEQCARNLYHVGLLVGHGKMDMLPHLPPHPSNRVRKGGARFVIPRRTAHAGRSLFNQQLGGQRDNRIEAQQRWGGAGNGAIIPLTLRFHPQMRPYFFKRHFHRPATDKPGQHLLRGMTEIGRQQGLRFAGLLRISEQGPAEGAG